MGVEVFAGQGGEGAVGAELQIRGDALVGEGLDAVGEADGCACVVGPVGGGGQGVGVGELSGDVGQEGEGGGVEGQAGQCVFKVGEHGLHAGGVEGVGDGQASGADALCGQFLCCFKYGFFVAGQDGGGGAVDGGDVDTRPGGEVVFGGGDGDHGAAFGQCLHQASAGGDQSGRVLQRQDPCYVCGGDLTDGVSADNVGGDAPGGDEPVEGDFQGEECGLRVQGLVEAVGVVSEDNVACVVAEGCADFVERLAVHGERFVQLAPHAEPLGALPGEEHRQPPAGHRASHDAGCRLAPCHRVQAGQCLVAVAGQDDRAVR
ncbi:putative protein OS=Streptomyces fumanus OX=67302 GN=GCM10018772_62450 PE=4 SV=1 [Streptomyces fumanus]